MNDPLDVLDRWDYPSEPAMDLGEWASLEEQDAQNDGDSDG